MKASPSSPLRLRREPSTSSPLVQGLFVVVLTLQSTFAYEKPVLTSPPPLAGEHRVELGSLGVVVPSGPAAVRFDSARGQIESAGEQASSVASLMLSAPAPIESYPGWARGMHPHACTPAGMGASVAAKVGADAVVVVLTPIAAAVIGQRAKSQLVPADKLAALGRGVDAALAELSGQDLLREAFLRSASQNTRRRLIALPGQAAGHAVPGGPALDHVLEIATESVSLEKLSASDESFVLRLQARARVTRLADGAVLYDEPFLYQSGSGLFLDYAANRGAVLKLVAQTGHRKLAERMVEQLFTAGETGPVLVKPNSASSRRPDPARAAVATPAFQFIATRTGRAEKAPTWAANRPVANLGVLGVVSTSAHDYVAVRRPVTKREAVAEATQRTEEVVRDVTDSPNSIISLTGLAASVPIGFGLQVSAAARGMSHDRLKQLNAAISVPANRPQLDQHLDYEIARAVSDHSTQPVVVFRKSVPAEAGLSPYQAVSHRPGLRFAALPSGEERTTHFRRQGVDHVLEIEIRRAALNSPKEGLNPRMTLQVEARARLLRVRDGAELDSVDLRYESEAHRFADWAGQDARRFRDELVRVQHGLTEALVSRLTGRRILSPEAGPATILATN